MNPVNQPRQFVSEVLPDGGAVHPYTISPNDETDFHIGMTLRDQWMGHVLPAVIAALPGAEPDIAVRRAAEYVDAALEERQRFYASTYFAQVHASLQAAADSVSNRTKQEDREL